MPDQAKSKERRLFEGYVSAKDTVISEGYANEIDWQAEREIKVFTESEFLCEAAWVILNSGMRESIIRTRFPSIRSAFRDFESAKMIVENREQCIRDASKAFRHSKKLAAIISIACRIYLDGFGPVRTSTLIHGAKFLSTFDYLGPATSLHLAKNLGLDVAKPDRHLKRVAEATGFSSVDDLCMAVSNLAGDSKAVVDIVIWRFATLRTNYLTTFC